MKRTLKLLVVTALLLLSLVGSLLALTACDEDLVTRYAAARDAWE